MRKVILGLAVTLDGFIEGANGEYDWCFTDQDYGLNEFFKKVDAVFMGRKSFEMSQEMGGGGWSELKHYIFSSTWKQAPENTVLVQGDVKGQVLDIKNQPGKDIWLFGGASLTASLLKMGLVDELWLSIHPILLGKGKPLFSGLEDRVSLSLLESKTYDTGLVSLIYQVNN